MTNLGLLMSLVVCACGPTATQPSAVVLDASKWWGHHSVRLPENRTHVVLLFRAGDSDRIRPLVPVLARLDGRRDVRVVALSPDPPRKVRPVIVRLRMGFLAGAGTTLHKRLKIKQWPALLILRPASDPSRWQMDMPGSASVRALSLLLGTETARLPASGHEVADMADGGDVAAEYAAFPALRKRALTGSHEARREALRTLYDAVAEGKLRPEPFLELCEQLLAEAPPPEMADYYQKRALWFGEVAYLAHLADPTVTVKQPLLSPGDLARRDADPLDRAVADAYKADLASKSLKALRDDYVEHLTETNSDLLIREAIIFRFAELAPEEVTPVLAELTTLEQDAYLRWQLVGTIGYLCEKGACPRERLIGELEGLLEVESDVRRVRPLLIELLNEMYERATGQ